MSRRARFDEPFAALDFETANHDASSVCAVGIVRVERGVVVARRKELVRPPTRSFRFTRIHGIRVRDVTDAPTFGELWPTIFSLFDGVEFVAAHNASFERRVVDECRRRFGTRRVGAPFLCTMRLARETWGVRPTRLPDVAAHIGVQLRHHDPLSDAEVCADIVLAAHGAPPCASRSAEFSSARVRSGRPVASSR